MIGIMRELDPDNPGLNCLECDVPMVYTDKDGDCGCRLIRCPRCGATESECCEIYPREAH